MDDLSTVVRGCTTLLAGLPLPKSGLVFDLEALYVCLQTVPDHRNHLGLQYPLASLLMIGVLAKLAGQDSSRAMPYWAKLRTYRRDATLHEDHAQLRLGHAPQILTMLNNTVLTTS